MTANYQTSKSTFLRVNFHHLCCSQFMLFLKNLDQMITKHVTIIQKNLNQITSK